MIHRRTQFTEEDEQHLCEWIAAKIPYKETGGRTGNRLYQQLCEMVCKSRPYHNTCPLTTATQSADPEYAWVTRHTWQSWRERYKKNSARLDTKISEIVEQKKPAHGAKGQYGYVRAPEEKPRRIRPKKGSTNTNGTTLNNNGLNGAGPAAGPSNTSAPELQELENFPPVPMPVVPGVLAPVPAAGYPPIGPGMPGLLYAGAAPMAALTPEAARRHATEEEMEDDEGEWQIRVGDPGAPQPAWAKRKQEAEGSDQGGSKRQRTGWVAFSRG